MEKNLTQSVNAIKEVSLSKVKSQLESGAINPPVFMTLEAPKKLYVKLLIFQRHTPEEACRLVARSLMAAGSPATITPEELRAEYMFDTAIRQAINELTRLYDDEYSLSIHMAGRVASGVLENLMLNNPDPDIQLRAASKLADLASKDYADKRGKTRIDIAEHKTSTHQIIMQINPASSVVAEELPPQDIIDATLSSGVSESPEPEVKKKRGPDDPLDVEDSEATFEKAVQKN